MTTQSDSIESCWKRSKTNLGSSTLNPETVSPDGILSTNPDVSPFASWTKAILLYCDGTMFTGLRNEPISYKGDKIYFRANAIMRQNFDYLNK